ncbi:MAG: FtsW/RodA/SpoVE family cell cycle protein [Oscillospiraceae bacterium]
MAKKESTAGITVHGVGRPKQVAQARKSLNAKLIISEIDKPFFLIVLVLLVFGLIMMFSASYATSLYESNNPYAYLKTQLVAAVLGMVILIGTSFLDYHFFQNTKVVLFSFAIVEALSLFTAMFGNSTADASRWISIGPLSFQPSELLKIVFIMVFAYMLALNFPKFKSMKYSIVPFALIIGATCFALVLQRHLSAVLLVLLIGIAMMFVGDVPKKHMVIFLGAGLGLIVLFVLFMLLSGSDKFSYLTTRFQSWRDPMSDISGDTAQTYQGLLAIGSGGWFGLGFGNSRQKYLYLPESQNDFIFSIICEELGFFGALAVIILFLLFVIRGFYIAVNAKDRFGMLLAVGIVLQIGLQAFLNIAVSCNAFPNTGIALPFFSSGGTALVFQLAEMGILLNISRQRARKK